MGTLIREQLYSIANFEGSTWIVKTRFWKVPEICRWLEIQTFKLVLATNWLEIQTFKLVLATNCADRSSFVPILLLLLQQWI
jgi:hypothetical protein